LGSFLARLSDHGVFGPTLGKAKSCLEQAIAVGPNYLPNCTSYARSYAVGAKDAELSARLVATVLAAPGGNWPFWDEYARDQALRLAQRRDPYFPPG